MPKHYDIFLSYASADNTNLAEPYNEQSRWVMCFKVALQEALDRELGRTGVAKWFLDAQELRAGEHLNTEIQAALAQTKVFVALASPGYFNQDSWCKMEREHFMKGLGPDPSRARRMYAILLDEEMRSEWEKNCFSGVLDFPFYDKDKATERCMRLGEGKISAEFLQRTAVLAKDIAVRIREIEREENNAPDPTVHGQRGTIFLAAVPGEVEDRRSELAEFLIGEGWRVVPKRNVCDSDPEKCHAATKEACVEAKAFIQILSRFPWKPHEYDRIQFAAAQDSKKPVFRYRSDDIEVRKLPNEEHAKWLQEHDVHARSMPATKDEIRARLNAILETEARQAGHTAIDPDECDGFISLSTSMHERVTIGRSLADRLVRDSVFPYIPADAIPQLERCFLDEHGFMVVFGSEVYSTRLEPVLLHWRMILLKRRPKTDNRPPIAIYLSDPPPENKHEAINVRIPGMRVIRSGDDIGFRGFVDAVKDYARRKTELPTE